MKSTCSLPRYAALASALLVFTACGEKEEKCFDDRSCGNGQRCVSATAGEAGVCKPCDAIEIPYDGIDNDCNSRTRDSDLDGDGDNSVDAPVRPGRDCDDNDPLVNSNAEEVCADNKDNDCDGDVDEIDCGDRNPPTVRFVGLANGAAVSRTVSLMIEAFDDVGIVRFELYANTVQVNASDLPPTQNRTFMISLDTTTFADGPITLRASATDVKARETQATLTVQVDNTTPPEVVILEPAAGGSYSGLMLLDADVTDASGVGSVEFLVDGNSVAMLTAAPYELNIGTSSLAEGLHTFRVEATDVNGSRAGRSVEFLIDRTAPMVWFTAPQNNVRGVGLVPVSVTATDAAGISQILSRGRTSATGVLNYDFDTTTVPNGPFVISAMASDSVIIDGGSLPGNTATAEVTVLVENLDPSPVVQLTRPLDGWGVFRNTLISANVTSGVMNVITRVEFTVNGALVATDTQTPYETAYDFTRLTGSHFIEVTAFDSQMNMGTATATVTVVPGPTFRLADVATVPGTFTGGYDIGDLNGDGVADLVTVGSELAVHTGTMAAGRWSTLPPVRIANDSAIDVRIADVDRDTRPDLITVSASLLRVYFAQPAGGFGAAVPTNIPQGGLQAFDVADLDGDGDPDVVAGGTAVPAIVLRVNNNVYQISQVLGGDVGVTDLLLVDIDGDNDRDIVVGRAGAGNNVVSVYRNGGAGNFGAAQDSFTTAPPEFVAVGDVTGDSVVDIVAIMPSIDSFTVLRGVPATPGTFTNLGSVATQAGPRGIAVGDMDGDGRNDVVVAAARANGVEVWLGQPNGSFAFDASYAMAQDLRRPRLYDLDGDNDRDVLGAGISDNAVAYARNLGGAQLSAAPTLPFAQAPRAIAVGNVVAGPAPDIVMAFERVAATPPRVGFLENLGGGAFQFLGFLALPDTVTPPTSIAVGDLTGNGFPDVAVGSSAVPGAMNDITAAFLLNQGANVFAPLSAILDRPVSVAIGDVDNDGAGEAVFTLDPQGAAFDGSVVLQVDGNGQNYVIYEGEGARGVATGNFDSDPGGLVDYAVANGVTDNITVNIWNGLGFNTTTYNAAAGIIDITIGLVNNDNIFDIVGISQTTLFVMEGNPAFGFATPVQYPAGQSPSALIGGDFNRDGLFDTIVLNTNDRASLLIARPQGGFFPPVPIALSDVPVDFVAADLDGDGRDDLAIAHTGVPSVMLIFSNADSL